MQVSVFFVLVSFARTIPFDNPAILDILKVVIGSTTWIGSMVAYMYWREKKLKTAAAK